MPRIFAAVVMAFMLALIAAPASKYLTGLSPWDINGELRNLELSMGSLFNFSFFITQNMKTQLREGPVYGALPILYVFLARTGKTIHEVGFVSLDEHGS